MEELEAQLNEIEQALDTLESRNDVIHSKLKELLVSNREIRKEMIDLGLINENANATPQSETNELKKLQALSIKPNPSNESTSSASGGGVATTSSPKKPITPKGVKQEDQVVSSYAAQHQKELSKKNSNVNKAAF